MSVYYEKILFFQTSLEEKGNMNLRKRIYCYFCIRNSLKYNVMRTIFCVLATLMLGLTSLQAQSLKAIKLNAPDKTRGASVMKALADRHSEREFANKKLSLQDLSDLMWAAIGINREDGKRTAASALNKQDVDVYVLMEEGAYLYHSESPIN